MMPGAGYFGAGEAGVHVYIAGNDRTPYLVPGGMQWPRYGGGGGGGATGAASGGALKVTQTAIGRSNASFDINVHDDSGFVPRATQIVTISENGTKLFSGCIKACSSDPKPGSFTEVLFHVDCVDKASICDNRVVIKTYPAGTDVQSMILDIVANFLNGEGITTGGVDVEDSLDTAMIFNTVSVSAAFDRITSVTGAQWWIDFNGVLYFVVIQSALQAPFGLTTTSNNFRNFVSTETTLGYANKFYAISNLVVLPNGSSGESSGGAISVAITSEQGSGYNIGDTVGVIGGDNNAVLTITGVTVSSPVGGVTTFSVTNPGTGYIANTGTTYPTADITGTGSGFTVDITGVTTQQNGVGGLVREESYTFVDHGGQPFQDAAWQAGLAPGYVLLDLPIQAVSYVKINGSSVPVYPLSGGFQGGFAYYWFDGDAQARVIFPEGGLPSIGDVIVIGYIPVNQNATVQTGTPLTGTCGSGLVEGVLQVPDINIQSQLDAIAAAYLARNGTAVPFLISYESDEQGLAIGQQQSIDLPLVGLAATTIYITSVTLSVDSTNRGANSVSGFGSAFRCAVEATTQQNQGNWLTWFERFITRTNYPLPLPRYEQAIAVLASGGSLAAANPVPTDAYEAKNAGLVFAVSANAIVPPTGQNLVLQWLVNGVPLLTSPLVIPAGISAIVYATAAQIPPGFAIFKGDLFTCSVAYQVTGASPTAAGSVSFYCDWSY